MGTEHQSGFRLSPQQERLWQWQAQSDGVYVVQCTLQIRGGLDASRLLQALRRIVSRHEILRTGFRKRPGMSLPFQVIADAGEVCWQTHDVSALAEQQQRTALMQMVQRERTGFDLEGGAVVRALLVKLAEKKHGLVLSLPALCADTASLRNLVHELQRGYAGLTAQDASETMQYADVVEWQNELLEAEETRIARDHWKERAASLQPSGLLSPRLPFEKNASSSGASVSVAISLPAQISTALWMSGSKLGVSAGDVVLACWAALLWRVSGRQDVPLAIYSDGRRYEELQSACGLFGRYLPISLPAGAGSTFADLCKRAQQANEEASKWQDGFSWKQPEWSGHEGLFFPYAFEYEEWSNLDDAGEIRIQVEEVYSCLDRFRLKLVAREMGGRGLRVELHYDPACFEQETVARLARQFATLLASALENPAARVRELALLTAGEEQELLQRWNQTAADYPALCLQQWFEAQAARTPSALAVRCGDAALSYGELNAQANQLAHALRKAGVGPDTLVGLLLDRSLELITGLLAILKAGGAYVPLNPGTPAARLEQQLSGAQAVVTVAALRTQLPSFAGKVLDLDSDRDALAGESTANPACTTTPENLAYVLYTSGSTGVPKGVAVRHRNLVNYTQFMVRKLGLEKEPGLQLATVSTLAADLGNTCIFPALVAGGCLHVIPYEISTDAARLAEYVARYPIDVLKIVPSHLSALLAAAEGRPILPRRNLITGGEALKPELVERIRQAAASCQLLNHYGPTETTIGSLTFEVEEYAQVCRWAEWTVPIGRPIANTRVYVLDEDRRPVPVGTPGELYIGGDGVAAGYWQQPQLTAERFVPEPFVTEATAKMYRTGDRVRQLPNGAIEFLGRADDQVKIRGFRIELGEIEAVLGEHSGVRQAVVLAREQENGEQRLVAYVVARTRPAPNRETLSQHLLRKLPDYMVPAAWVVLEELPLNANGKVDRQALPAPEEARGLEYVAPRTAVEEVVAGMWAEVLKLERVGVHEDLFRLGAHSLLATQVVSRVRRVFRVEIPLRAMFETPTVAGLAEKIELAKEQGQTTTGPSLVAVSRERFRAEADALQGAESASEQKE
jgi:amino acid adenylation domain-containing protein